MASFQTFRRRLALSICPELSKNTPSIVPINGRAMNTQTLLKLAEEYASHKGYTLSTVSTYAAFDGKFFTRLKAGSGCTVKTATRLHQWFSNNWPADCEWPADIPRLVKSEEGV